MTLNSKNLICHLCKTNEATKTGSHLLPASLIAAALGKRNFEEVYSIRPESSTPIELTFGRSNLKNLDPAIKQLPFVKDYIFCPDCENKLSVIEGVINPILTTRIKDTNQKVNFPVTKLSSSSSYLTCTNVNPCIFRLYIFSLLWRMNLLFRFETGQDFMQKSSEVEWFRVVLKKCLALTQEETLALCNLDELEEFKFVICCCLEDHDKTTNKVIPHPNYKLPYCFLFNEYLILFYFTPQQLHGIETFIRLNDFNLDRRLINESGAIKIGVSQLINWQKFNSATSSTAANDFIKIRGDKLSQKNGKNFNDCVILIDQKAKEIQRGTNKMYADCFDEAFKFLYNQDY